jgi:hypothetical protein
MKKVKTIIRIIIIGKMKRKKVTNLKTIKTDSTNLKFKKHFFLWTHPITISPNLQKNTVKCFQQLHKNFLEQCVLFFYVWKIPTNKQTNPWVSFFFSSSKFSLSIVSFQKPIWVFSLHTSIYQKVSSFITISYVLQPNNNNTIEKQ